MERKEEQQLLKDYASVAKSKILGSQSDLDPKDRAMPAMLGWCRRQEPIVVLQSGTILCSNPSSRIVQNCKIVMAKQGLTPKFVYPATSELIAILLENAEETSEFDFIEEAVSIQQQRLRRLVGEALAVESSDIHLEVREDIARIRFRKHGELFLHAEWLPKLAREVASVAFNKETDHAVTHFNPLVPQNASMPLIINNREIRLRLASLPAHGGFDVVMRILTMAEEKILSVSELGYLPSQIDLIKKAVSMPYGAVILSWTTGSGKTTTLASCMSLVSDERKVYTIEDPVEKVVENATQIPVNTEQYDRSFASMARTALRMDPDVIVLGEMRDEDTVKVLMRAAITGHLVFSTVHTNTASGIITRLMDLGASASLLSSPQLLVCLICQRLVPKLCETCAVPVETSGKHRPHVSRWRDVFGNALSRLRARGQNCLECLGLGISGRTIISEIIWVDERGREFIQVGDLLGWKHYLKENGWKSYHDQLLDYVRDGICDPLDAEKLLGEITPMMGMHTFNYSRMKTNV